MSLEERKNQARTSLFKAIFPNTTNHYDTLFGGTAMQWMDEVSFICATRFAKKKVVTVSSSKIDFKNPIPEGTIVEFIAEIERVGNTSLDVKVEVFVEEMYKPIRKKAIEGILSFVAVDENMQPVAISS